MANRVFPLPQFEGEEARAVIGDFGPFGIEMISFQVLRDKRKWWGGIRPTWVTLRSTFFDADKGLTAGYDFEGWAQYMIDFVRTWAEDELAEARARRKFYAED